MPDLSKLTPQQAKDIKPILDRFPKATLDRNLSPTIFVEIIDAEADPVSVRFDEDGIAHVDTSGYEWLMLTRKNLSHLINELDDAQELLREWQDTPSGKEWFESL
jgi:hypothetical protein